MDADIDDIDIEQTIKDRLSKIDSRLDSLIAQKKAISDEIRDLRESRVPVARLARAVAPRTRQPKTAMLGTVASPTPDSA
jgi:hypothetical protein